MSIIFTPKKIGNMEIKNRIVRSATYYALADHDGKIGEKSVELIKTLAAGQVGLIITGYAYIDRTGQSFVDMNGISEDDHIPGYQKMTTAVHNEGGKIAMQIAHCGSGSFTAANSDIDFMCVSPVEKADRTDRLPRVMTEEDILKIIDDFASAAGRVEEAGFDGVQLHGAHGYLISQFLSPVTNQRDDQWGGSLENRMRFALEVTRAVKSKVASNFPVMIKLGCHDWREDGQGLSIEEGAKVAKALEDEGISFIEISHSLVDRFYGKKFRGVTSPEQEAYMLSDAQPVRDNTTIPLGLVGGMRSMEVMEKVLDSGVVDFITLCRPFIREPGLIKRWQDGDIRKADCITCGRCFNLGEGGNMSIECSQINK